MIGKAKLRAALSGLFTAAFMWLLLFAPTPYVVYEPGIAIPLDGMVSVPAAHPEAAEGRFMMTTVKMSSSNYWRAFVSLWSPDMDLYDKKSIMGRDTEEQYMSRMTTVMQGSQDSAVEAAYRYAGIGYRVLSKQVVVAGSPEKSVLKAGDIVVRVSGGEPVDSMADLAEAAKGASGGLLPLVVKREGKETVLNVKLAKPSLALDEGGLAQALQVSSLVERRELVPDDPINRVSVDAGEVGGPSAGLMFALKTADLLTEGDLTGGLKIAGTGTINAEGRVGPIGGVSHKVAAANREGAQLFLAPDANAEEAAAKARAIGSSMKVVGVGTLQAAAQAIQAEANTATH